MGSKAPAWLNQLGKRYWRTLSPMVEPSQSNLDQLALLCDSWATYRKATEIIDQEGLTITTNTGSVKPHPCIAIKTTSQNQIAKLTKTLGLDAGSVADELDEFLTEGS